MHSYMGLGENHNLFESDARMAEQWRSLNTAVTWDVEPRGSAATG
jgi:hypothetical protein